jgi:hypothetical protein
VVKPTGRWEGTVRRDTVVYRYRTGRRQIVREKFAGRTSGRPWPKNGPNRHWKKKKVALKHAHKSLSSHTSSIQRELETSW